MNKRGSSRATEGAADAEAPPEETPPPIPTRSGPEPTVGRQVHFRLNRGSEKAIGQLRPATVVAVNEDGTVNLQVLTNSDGNKRGDDLPALLWVEKVAFGTEPGTCQWPELV